MPRRQLIFARTACLAMVWLMLMIIGSTNGGQQSTSAAHADATAEVDDRVEQLIKQLGSAEFASRQRARDELLRLGVAAFDALHRAQLDEDVEVRKQAEYLVRAIRVAWVRENDSLAVRQILRTYRNQSMDERLTRVRRLARMDGTEGIAPLCRIVRFETSDNISKRAALLIMQRQQPDEQANRHGLADLITQGVASSRRSGADWLRLYARYLRAPDSTMLDWKKLAEIEEQALRDLPSKTRLLMVRDFLRWQIEMFERHGRTDDAIEIMRRTLPLQDGSRPELLEIADWLIDRSAWPLMDVLVESFDESFKSDPYLMYRHAEAQQKRGQLESAAAIVQAAMRIQIEDEQFLHVEVGYDLQQRGLIEWAQNEYQHVIDGHKEGSQENLAARIQLGYMLHDQGRDLDAFNALRPIVDLMDKDKSVVRVVQSIDKEPTIVRSQMHFSHALHLRKIGDHEGEIEQLRQAIRYYPLNADILIAMYRVPDAPQKWRAETLERIQQTAARFRSGIVFAERSFKRLPNSAAREQLAMMLNQYAWLVSNTEGNYRSALESSKQSLELLPDDAGYLDTLGRCYFALEDYQNAVKHQRRAVKLEPHSGQIRRQLALFEKTFSEKGPGKPADADDQAEESPASVSP